MIGVFFSDECKLNLHPGKRQYVRRNTGKRFKQKYITPSHKFSSNVYLNQTILDQALPEIYTSRRLFQQDDANCHTSRSTAAYLCSKTIRILSHWPAQSLDLSVIENLWDILKTKRDLKCPKTKEELWEVAKTEIEDIPTEKIQELYDSIPRRISAVIAARGENTEH